MSIKRPTSVTVGYNSFEINWIPGEDWVSSGFDEEDAGICQSSEGKIFIRVDDGYTENALREILLHEILHAVWYMSGLTFHPGKGQKDIEEYIVCLQALTLINVMQNNPMVMDYIMNR